MRASQILFQTLESFLTQVTEENHFCIFVAYIRPNTSALTFRELQDVLKYI